MDILKDTLINPVEEKQLLSISSGISPADKIKDDLLQASEHVKTALNAYVDDRLTNLTKSMFDPIKKLRMGTFSTMKKKKNVHVKGREVQFSSQSEIFGKVSLISQTRDINLKDIFKYPLGLVPYSLCDEMGIMVKNKKSDLLAELEKDTVLVEKIPAASCSIIDGMALVRKVKCSGLTFSQVADVIFKAALLSSRASTRIDIVFDVYFDESIKNVERSRRCSENISVSFKKIIGNNIIRQWHSFLGEGNNKTELIKFLVSEWKSKQIDNGKIIYATYGSHCICINDGREIAALKCQQEEADTRMLLHANHASNHRFSEVVIHTPDTDVIVIAVALANTISSDMFIKAGVKDKARIISINRIIQKLPDFSTAVTDAIIGFHAFTGCDTVSAFWRKGKIRPWNLMLKTPVFVETFAKLRENWVIEDDELILNCESFVCAMYGSITFKRVTELRFQCTASAMERLMQNAFLLVWTASPVISNVLTTRQQFEKEVCKMILKLQALLDWDGVEKKVETSQYIGYL